MHLWLLNSRRRVFLEERGAEVDPQARSFGYMPFGKGRLPAPDENLVVFLDLSVAFLHDEEIRGRRGNVKTRSRTHGSIRIMGSERDIVSVRHSRNLLHRRNATRAGYIRLKDAGGALFE